MRKTSKRKTSPKRKKAKVKVLRKPRKSSLKSPKLTKKKTKNAPRVSFTTDDETGQRRIEGHWDRRHKSEKGYGGPFISPRPVQDYISPEARHWEQVHQAEGDYGDEEKRAFGNRYSQDSPEEKRRRKEKTQPQGFGQEMQDIEDEKFDDEDYHPGRKKA